MAHMTEHVRLQLLQVAGLVLFVSGDKRILSRPCFKLTLFISQGVSVQQGMHWIAPAAGCKSPATPRRVWRSH